MQPITQIIHAIWQCNIFQDKAIMLLLSHRSE